MSKITSTAVQFSNLKPVSISVVLPTYNRLQRLKACLPSFLKTKLESVEFIIIDNFSDDGTWEYLLDIEKKDCRIRALRNPQNVGGIKTIFRGYCEVRSGYVIFLADDDLMDGDYISRCLEIFESHPDVGMIHHLFDGWKRDMDKHTDPYTIHKAGETAIQEVFMKSGSYPGIAWRMDCINLREFPLADGKIYPQVKVSLEIASQYSVASIHDCGLLNVNFGDTALTNKVVQNRPDDFGIGERLSYVMGMENQWVIQQIAKQMSEWAIEIYEELQRENPEDARRFCTALSETLHKITPYLLIKMIKRGYWIDSLLATMLTIKSMRFIKFYLVFLAFSVRKMYLKARMPLFA